MAAKINSICGWVFYLIIIIFFVSMLIQQVSIKLIKSDNKDI